jgi:hypothetical protein
MPTAEIHATAVFAQNRALRLSRQSALCFPPVALLQNVRMVSLYRQIFGKARWALGRVTGALATSPPEPPWESVPIERIPQAPGMLSALELKLLYHLARDVYSGEGAIVDAGAFLGSSAAALAAGLRDNPRVRDKKKRITSYDLFEYQSFCEPYFEGRGFHDGDDLLPVFAESLGDLAELVTPVKGDICRQTWAGGDIEILFVDFTQNWDHDDFVVKTFFSKMVPGQTTLVHQDYVYTVCYWLHVFMEEYADSFEPISRFVPGATAVWRYIRPLPDEVFERPTSSLVPISRMFEHIDRSIARYQGVYAGLLDIARNRLVLHAYGAEKAADELEALRARYGEQPALGPHMDVLGDQIEGLRGQPSPWAHRFVFD